MLSSSSSGSNFCIAFIKPNPGGRSGPQIKQVLVYSSDPKTSEFRLTLRGETKQDVTFSAEAFMPGRIRPDQSVEMKLDFTNGGAAPMRVTRTETASPNLVTSFDEIEAGKKYVIRVKTVPPLPNGTMQGSIRIHTDSTNQPLLELPFYAIVTGPLVVAPPQIDLVPSTEPISRFVFINTGVVTNFSVLKVETPDPAITSEQVKSGGGGVRIMFNNLVAKKELDGTAIKITTDAEGMNEILIPIHIVPRGGK